RFGPRAPYGRVAPALYLGSLFAFWPAPTMTVAPLVLAVATTAYILLAIQFEERDLIRSHGKTYRNYRDQTSMIIPMPPRRGNSGGARNELASDKASEAQ